MVFYHSSQGGDLAQYGKLLLEVGLVCALLHEAALNHPAMKPFGIEGVL